MRVPRGLLPALSLQSSGQGPNQFEDSVRGVLEMLQFYGQTQLQVQVATNAALAEGNGITIQVPATQHWVAFSICGTVVKTATMTALRCNVGLAPQGSVPAPAAGALYSEELGPFGATETGNCSIAYAFPYPRLLLPGTLIAFGLEILGTDATASCTLSVTVGVLG